MYLVGRRSRICTTASLYLRVVRKVRCTSSTLYTTIHLFLLFFFFSLLLLLLSPFLQTLPAVICLHYDTVSHETAGLSALCPCLEQRVNKSDISSSLSKFGSRSFYCCVAWRVSWEHAWRLRMHMSVFYQHCSPGFGLNSGCCTLRCYHGKDWQWRCSRCICIYKRWTNVEK